MAHSSFIRLLQPVSTQIRTNRSCVYLRSVHAGKGRVPGGQGKGGRHGGGGRNVRGVDFGLGIGYSADAAISTPTAPQVPPLVRHPKGEAQMRGSVVESLKRGVMVRFKNSFVAANTGNPVTSISQDNVFDAPSSPNGRSCGKFVPLGIGTKSPPESSFTPGNHKAQGCFQGRKVVERQVSSSGGALDTGSVQPEEDGGRAKERSRWDRNWELISDIQEKLQEPSVHEVFKQGHKLDGNSTRQRRRPSGWDR